MDRKTGSRNIPAGKCNAVYDAICTGASVKDVTKCLQIPRSTASNILRRTSLHRSGIMQKSRRPNKLNFYALTRLEQTLVNNRFLHLDKFVAVFNYEGSVSIARRSLQKYVRIIGYCNGSVVRKQFLEIKI